MRKWSLNKKVVTLMAGSMATTVALMAFGIERIQEVGHEFNEAFENSSKRVSIAKNMQNQLNELRVQEKVFILEENNKKNAADVINQVERGLRENIENYKKVSDADGVRTMASLSEDINKWRKVSDELQKASLAGDDKKAANIARGASKEALLAISSTLEDQVKLSEKSMREKRDQLNQIISSSVKFLIIFTVASIVIGLFLTFGVLKTMNTVLNKVISNLADSSKEVNSAANKIAETSSRLAGATTQQAESLQETATSVEQLNSMVQKNADNAQQSASFSRESEESATRGKQVVAEMLAAIEGINSSNNNIMDQVNHSNQQIADIVKVISEIGDKTKVINDIVFQTKLLSFNASVEAARAGEHGKGFAVVAEEVGNLAQMSGNAAKEISTMLDSSIRKVEGIVSDTKQRVEGLIVEGRKRVESGSKVARDCEAILNEIVSKVTNVSTYVSEIANASQVQSQGIGEVTKAMGQLDGVTQENTASAEQSAAASEQLKAQAGFLRGSVKTLIQTIKGEDSNWESHTQSSHASSDTGAWSKAAPMVAKSTPVATKSTPVAAKSTPVATKSTPVAAKSTSVAAKSTSVVAKSTLKAKRAAKAKVAPKVDSTPVTTAATPTVTTAPAAQATPVAHAAPVEATPKESALGRIIPFKKRDKKPAQAAAPTSAEAPSQPAPQLNSGVQLKKAVGLDFNVPSENDPGFKDV